MKHQTNESRLNRVAVGTSSGFLAGAVFGCLVSVNGGDLALWLSIGIGSGISLGAAAALILNRKVKPRSGTPGKA